MRFLVVKVLKKEAEEPSLCNLSPMTLSIIGIKWK